MSDVINEIKDEPQAIYFSYSGLKLGENGFSAGRFSLQDLQSAI